MQLDGRLVMAFVLASTIAACGDDSGKGGGMDSGTDSGYTPPPPAMPDASGDSGATATGMPFECNNGATMCTTPEFMLPPGVLGGADGGGGGLPAGAAALLGGGASICSLIMACNEGCCTSDNKCGVRNPALTGPDCVEQNQPGSASTECPEVMVLVNNPLAVMFTGGPLPVPIPGCCRDDGQCGLDLMYLGEGCVERSQAALGSMVTPPDGGTAMLESIPCTQGAGGGDSGTADGG